MFRYISLSISSMMSFNALQRRLHVIQIQPMLRLNHILIAEERCKRRHNSRCYLQIARYNRVSNYINPRSIGIQSYPVVNSRLFNFENVVHQNIRSFSIDYGRRQKHLLEPSIAENAAQPQFHSSENEQSPYDANSPFLATLKVNRELLRSGARSCRHIEFDIDGSNMKYEAGDHIGIYPTNENELVEKLGKLCDANLDAKLDDSKLRPHTFRTALTHHIEIAAVPQLHVLKALTEYCSKESDKKFLDLISSTTRDGKDLYQSCMMDAQRNIVHVLEDIKSCRPPIAFVCEMLPKLQPRYYSISSSSRIHPNVVHMTVVLVKYETKTGRINRGVATAFLEKKNPEEATCEAPLVPVFIRKSQFHLPEDVQTPIIMIGTGTGLAPFLGFIQERNHCRESGESIGQSTLYFGARKRNEDFIYEQELSDFETNGTLKLRTIFSRDQPEKRYVTQLMQEDADSIWNVIINLGHIYVCGDARQMANDVRNVLVNIIKTKGNMDDSSAEVYLKNMESQKRYVADVWS